MANEKRLIYAEDVAEKIDREIAVCNMFIIRDELDFLKGCLETIDTVDAVEVVRCKECDKSKRSPVFGDGWRFCKNNQQHHRDDHFCSYGERREGE